MIHPSPHRRKGFVTPSEMFSYFVGLIRDDVQVVLKIESAAP